jgi:hypothetical protein
MLFRLLRLFLLAVLLMGFCHPQTSLVLGVGDVSSRKEVWGWHEKCLSAVEIGYSSEKRTNTAMNCLSTICGSKLWVLEFSRTITLALLRGLSEMR